ncbi:hypothetical protein B0J18DRAFT_75507 [Chaetomium sp. MPI-SDFR-AT-0129]|nr:hypothetical protein B0J18DRAFT_75507 [Chaetomium sp. MPI-SDFR-AT-0129]
MQAKERERERENKHGNAQASKQASQTTCQPLSSLSTFDRSYGHRHSETPLSCPPAGAAASGCEGSAKHTPPTGRCRFPGAGLARVLAVHSEVDVCRSPQPAVCRAGQCEASLSSGSALWLAPVAVVVYTPISRRTCSSPEGESSARRKIPCRSMDPNGGQLVHDMSTSQIACCRGSYINCPSPGPRLWAVKTQRVRIPFGLLRTRIIGAGRPQTDYSPSFLFGRTHTSPRLSALAPLLSAAVVMKKGGSRFYPSTNCERLAWLGSRTHA